ncbi:MAG: DUF6132 family protein [Cytophagales bacterium]
MYYKYLLIVGFVLLGAGLGYLYYKYIGCSSGACPLTSNPYTSMLYGAFLSYLILSSILKF